jgi:hypothetical protein
MPIKVKCPNPDCGKSLNAKDELAGKTLKCPACQTPVTLPRAAAAPAVPQQQVQRQAPAAAKAPAKPAQPAKAAVQTTAPAKAAAPKKQAPPPPSDAEEDAEGDAESGAWEESAMLQHARFMTKAHLFSFWGKKFTISNPDTKEELGKAKEILPFWKVIVPPVARRFLPTAIEVRETDDGPVLFTVQKWPGLISFLDTVEILDDQKQKIGHFKVKIFSLLGGFDVFDAENQEVAKVEARITPRPRLVFVATDGRELGHVSSEFAEAKGVKFVVGKVGLTVSMADEMKDDIQVKVLVLATTLAMELTGAGTRLLQAK